MVQLFHRDATKSFHPWHRNVATSFPSMRSNAKESNPSFIEDADKDENNLKYRHPGMSCHWNHLFAFQKFQLSVKTTAGRRHYARVLRRIQWPSAHKSVVSTRRTIYGYELLFRSFHNGMPCQWTMPGITTGWSKRRMSWTWQPWNRKASK